MPKLKHYGPGKRVNVWIPEKYLETAELIDNLSKFLQIALDQAPNIMAWAILEDIDPEKFKVRKKIDDVIDKYNKKYPLDPLTQKRTGKWPKASPPQPDSWS